MKILLTGDASSIHTARWAAQLVRLGWDVHLYHSTPTGWTVCEELDGVTLHLPFHWEAKPGIQVRPTTAMGPIINRLRRHIGPLDRRMRARHFRALSRLIREYRPDVVHSLGLNINWMNMCGEVIEARNDLGARFDMPWIYSSWGTDLDYYAAMSVERRAEVEQVLSTCDYYVAECERDRRLATEMGLRGEFAGFLPAFGGVDSAHIDACRRPGTSSSRRVIFLKGRDHANQGDPVGRAMTAMRAIAACESELQGYRIVVGQADATVTAEAEVLAATTSLDIRVLPRLPYDAVLRIMGASRVLMALTVNDGLPSTLVEAMALGMFPIHSNLEPIAEWVTDGQNGLLVEPEDVTAVADALRVAINDGPLVDRAAEMNERLIETKLSEDAVMPQVKALYERVVAQGPTVPRA